MLPGGKQKCTVNRGNGKSGEVNTWYSIVKHDIISGEHNEARYIEGHGKSSPVNRGITVHFEIQLEIASNRYLLEFNSRQSVTGTLNRFQSEIVITKHFFPSSAESKLPSLNLLFRYLRPARFARIMTVTCDIIYGVWPSKHSQNVIISLDVELD